MDRTYTGYDSKTFESRYEWLPSIRSYKSASTEDNVYIGEQTFTVEAPDDFNPVPAQVAAIEAEKLAAMAVYQKSVADCNERLSKLLAIEHSTVAV
jgi:hypothetical protein